VARAALVCLCLALCQEIAVQAGDDFLVLCYHDVRDQHAPAEVADATAVGVRQLIAQFAWLREHGYTVISLEQALAAKAGKASLPPKAVMLTFDDGLRSCYTRVYPLLKLFGYPAVMALVTSWIEPGPDFKLKYGGRQLTAADFLTWDQVAEMSASGLVSFASHSHDLHRGALANPQGNEQPAGSARIYDPNTKRYESDAAFSARIRADLARSAELIEAAVGERPRAIVWPYGKYNMRTVDIAAELGMEAAMVLNSGLNDSDDLKVIHRYLITDNPTLDDFAWRVRHPNEFGAQRVVHIDLDYVYDPDPAQMNRNLSLLLERIKAMDISTVYLQAFADEDGDGVAHALYFPNRRLPVKADLFNRVAWQLKTRSGAAVYAWMPVLAFDVPPENGAIYVKADQPRPDRYRRLSPFHPANRELILDVYEDLAKHADFDGILFHDDAFFGDDEDLSPPALAHYRDAWDLPDTLGQLRGHPDWASRKTRFLIEFTLRLRDRAAKWRHPLPLARNLYARVVMQPEREAWFAQSYPAFLEAYDFTAVMAMPFMEDAAHPERWLKKLASRAKRHDPQLKKTIFELQAYDWRRNRPVPVETLVAQLELLQAQNAMQLGYYPDDFIRNHPPLERIRLGISLKTFPYRDRR